MIIITINILLRKNYLMYCPMFLGTSFPVSPQQTALLAFKKHQAGKASVTYKRHMQNSDVEMETVFRISPV